LLTCSFAPFLVGRRRNDRLSVLASNIDLYDRVMKQKSD